MRRHLLVSLMFLLAMDFAAPYVVDDKYPMFDDIPNLDDVQEGNFPKEPFDDMFHLDKKLEKNFPEEHEEDLPVLIKNKAKKLANGKCHLPVPPRYRKKERKSALRKYYQSFQHGSKSFISDEKWRAAKKSEKCTTCVLKNLCNETSVLQALSIDTSLPQKKTERMCINKIIKQALDVKPVKEKPMKCDPNAKFRTIDGTCNNLKNPTFGAEGTEFTRIADADYGDGISEPRRSVTGAELPNTRDISRFVHGSNADRTNPDSKILTHLTMNFGQFMDHDMSLAEAQGLKCEPPEADKNPECINIPISEDDAVFHDREVEFIELERDAPHEPVSDCKLVVREHPNTITAYIDASNVYGSTKEVADSVRAPDGLLLDMKHPHGCHLKNLLPPATEGFCPSRDPVKPCFLSGDERNNENQGLNSVHTIFVRHHNRIATFFGKKTKWDPERIYQETRRILGAQLQIITYGEFLPLILSEHTIKAFGLGLLERDEFFTDYDKKKNAQISTGFAVAAYRFGHSLVQEEFRRFTQDGFEHKCSKCGKDKTEFLPIPVLDFNNPLPLYESSKEGIDSILRGLVKGPAAKADGRFSSSVQENLMRGEGDLSDLVAINLRRSHERGAPGYITYRNLPLCKLPKVKSFEDLTKVAKFDPADVERLKKAYRGNIKDVDLFSGGMLEPRDPKGGVLGPTFQCIIADGFKRLKFGDRFWHENAPNASLNTDKTAFNRCQLRELRKTLFSKIICDNSDEFSSITKWAFLQSKIRFDCNELPKVNLDAWISPCKQGAVQHDEEVHDEF